MPQQPFPNPSSCPPVSAGPVGVLDYLKELSWNWYVFVCVGPFIKPSLILPWEVGRTGYCPCFTDKDTEARGSQLDLLTPH